MIGATWTTLCSNCLAYATLPNAALIDRLYETTARHFREVRVVEIEKMQQRAASTARRFDLHDLAADIWDAAALEDAVPLDEWIADQPESDALVSIPAERPVALSDDVMFSPNTVFFGKRRKTYVDCRSARAGGARCPAGRPGRFRQR